MDRKKVKAFLIAILICLTVSTIVHILSYISNNTNIGGTIGDICGVLLVLIMAGGIFYVLYRVIYEALCEGKDE